MCETPSQHFLCVHVESCSSRVRITRWFSFLTFQVSLPDYNGSSISYLYLPSHALRLPSALIFFGTVGTVKSVFRSWA